MVVSSQKIHFPFVIKLGRTTTKTITKEVFLVVNVKSATATRNPDY